MALALGWTLNEVMQHSPRQLQAMMKAMEQRARTQRMAAAHRNAPTGRGR
jgi:hypothetical protein